MCYAAWPRESTSLGPNLIASHQVGATDISQASPETAKFQRRRNLCPATPHRSDTSSWQEAASQRPIAPLILDTVSEHPALPASPLVRTCSDDLDLPNGAAPTPGPRRFRVDCSRRNIALCTQVSAIQNAYRSKMENGQIQMQRAMKIFE